MAMREFRCKGKRGFGVALAVCCGVAGASLARPARAQSASLPPPTSVEYLQYGVSLHTLTLLSSGAVCPERATTPCIVGSGGGLGWRLGYRARGPFYLG